MPDAWEVVGIFKRHFRLTNQQVAEILGYSASRVKQGINHYRPYQTEGGGWTSGPARRREGHGADTGSGAGEG